VTVLSVNDTELRSVGAENVRWSAGRSVTADVLSLPKPAVSPDNRPTNIVIRTMRVPIRANRPVANRRSLQATNTFSAFLCGRPNQVSGNCVQLSPQPGLACIDRESAVRESEGSPSATPFGRCRSGANRITWTSLWIRRRSPLSCASCAGAYI
jgi:hypothetical protein